MVFCVREIEALRLLGWCQYIRPAQLLQVVSETELSNLLTMKLIKYHGKSEALILTAEGRRLLAGTIWLPDTPRTYHADAVVRRLRLASLLLTAYQSGINVYALARERGYEQIALAALPQQVAEVWGPHYRDTGKARVFTLTEDAITQLLGKVPKPYRPPDTPYVTEKGEMIHAPLIKAVGKAGGYR